MPQPHRVKYREMPNKGITISVTAETNSGGRKHMEDYLSVKLAPNEHLSKIPEWREQVYVYVAVFDGHGGKEAAKYARERLWDTIQSQPKFQLSDAESMLKSIIHRCMFNDLGMKPGGMCCKQSYKLSSNLS